MRLHVTKYRIGARGHLVVRISSGAEIGQISETELGELASRLCDFSGPVGAEIACFHDVKSEAYVFPRTILGCETNAVDAAMAVSADASFQSDTIQRASIRLNDLNLEVEPRKTRSQHVFEVSCRMDQSTIRPPRHTKLQESGRGSKLVSEVSAYKVGRRKLAVGNFFVQFAKPLDQKEAIKRLSEIFDDGVDVVSITPSLDQPDVYYLLTVIEGEHRGLSCGDTAMIALDMFQNDQLPPHNECRFVDIDGVTVIGFEKDVVRVTAHASLVFSAEIDWDGERLGSDGPGHAHRSYQLNANMQGIMDHQEVVKSELEAIGFSEFGKDGS